MHAADADASIPPVELHVKNVVLQRTETGTFVIGAGQLQFLFTVVRAVLNEVT